jgi:predicted nucleotidyltransferase
LNKIKEFRDCEAVVVIMSGNFVQRGEPAIIDKWSRTEAALKNGVDLVIELPFVYSIQDARGFAYGAVSTLDKTGVIDKLVFGSESSKTKELKDIAKVLVNEPNELKTGIKKYLKEGLSFPNARKYALRDYLKKDTSILGRSNDILGLEYIYTLMKLGSRIEPITIKRVGANYNDKELSKIHSSATAIRNHIEKENNLNIDVPKVTKEILQREFSKGRGPVFYKDVSDTILTILNIKT